MAADDAIAIVGVGCRFPGADDLEEFWRVLLNGENHVTDIPQDRWNNAAFYDADKTTHAKLYTTKAGFVRSYNEWDNRFFGISDAEASRMDPQQKFVLDCVHMALEDGGFIRAKLNATNTGVYIGCMNSDLREMLHKDHSLNSSYDVTGTATSIASARVSFFYNLLGPSLCVDTACSSALVALHIASQALQTGDCEMAICGGVNSLLAPDMFLTLCRAGMMSATSQCQAFSDSADGYARGEGCGIVIIKPLKKALSDGNKVWGTVVTGCNQDGTTARPITAPSGSQQEQLLQHVYKRHGIDPGEVQYVEAHGTGTPVGDPVEANCLGKFFTEHGISARRKDKTLPIGSVKTNIGHLESAAGMAGLIKVLLMMNHGRIVPSLHITNGNPNYNPSIDFQVYNIEVPLVVRNWERNESNERIACVNSFGFGGTNCHAVIRQLQSETVQQSSTVHVNKGSSNIICLSAVDQESLRQTLEHVKESTETSDTDLSALAYTSCCYRDHFPYRTAIIARTTEEMRSNCHHKVQIVDKIKPPLKKRTIFVFCGVGTAWPGMCQELMVSTPAFRESINRVDEHLEPLVGWTAAEKFTSGTDYSDPFVNHIAIFACQVGLSDMWKHFGVIPDAVVGQSVGEVAAAYASGALSLKEAVKVIYFRSKALADKTGGKMLVVGNIDITIVEDMCEAIPGVSIAVYNSSTSCTVSGDPAAIDNLSKAVRRKAELLGTPVLLKELSEKCAYHSLYVQPAVPAITDALHTLEGGSISIEHISSVTSQKATRTDFRTGSYWADNVRKPVLLMQAIRKASRNDVKNHFVEIGPRQILKVHLSSIFDNPCYDCLPSMNPRKEDSCVQSTLASLYEGGVDVEWEMYYYPYRPVPGPLPRYPFHRQKRQFVPEKVQQYLQGHLQEQASYHMFVNDTGDTQSGFQMVVSKQRMPYVFDHFHNGAVLLQGATFGEVGFEVARRELHESVYSVDVSLIFKATLHPSGTSQCIEIHIDPIDKNGSLRFTAGNKHRIIAEGTVARRQTLERCCLDVEEIKNRCRKQRTKRDNYTSLEKLGFTYGESLSVLGTAWSCGDECLAEIELTASLKPEMSRTHLHPAILDGMLQVCGTFEGYETSGITFPKGIDHLMLNRALTDSMYAYVHRLHHTPNESHFDALLLTKEGHVIAELRNFFTHTIQHHETQQREVLYRLVWQEAKSVLGKRDAVVQNVVVFRLDHGMGHLCFDSNLVDSTETNLLQPNNSIDEVIELTLSSVEQKGINCVLFAPGKPMGSPESQTGDQVYHRARLSIAALTKLMKVLRKRSGRVPLVVVTEGTQSPCTGTCNPSIYGSELWGVVRTAIREAVMEHLAIVDVQSDGTKHEWSRLLCSVQKELEGETEMVITKGNAFVNRLIVHPNRHHEHRFRQLHTDTTASRVLVSSKVNAIHQPEWHLRKKSDRPRHTVLKLEWYCEHSNHLYPITEESSDVIADIWPESTADRFPVLAIEGGCVDSKQNDEEIVFCFPVAVSSTVSVSSVCSFRVKELPVYFPGLLTSAVVVWNLARSVHPESRALIVTQDNDCGLGILLAHLLRAKLKGRCKMVPKKSLLEQTTNDTMDGDTLILLTNFDKTDAGEFLPWLNGFKLVAARCCLRGTTERFIEQQFDISVDVIEHETLFKRSALQTEMPGLRDWIQSLDNDTVIALSKLSKTERRDLAPNSALPFSSPGLVTRISTEQGSKRFSEMKVTKSDLFRANGCYILVGGLSGLGWELLVLMAERGAGVLAPMSRRKSSPSRVNEIRGIETQTGCRIVCVQADITDINTLQKGVEYLKSQLNGIPIRGIFHGGGVLANAVLLSMTDEEIDTALKPKVLGAWNLHQISRDLPLDFFVLQSSITSIFGGFGQMNYAAGNSFLDSLAYYRRSQNLCGQSINWGALEVGMAIADTKTIKNLEKLGADFLRVSEIRTLFLDALIMNEVQLPIGAFNWDILLAASQTKVPAKFEIIDSSIAKRQDSHASAERVSRLNVQKFRTLQEKEQKDVIFNLVKSVLAYVLVVEGDMVVPLTTFSSLGADSMVLMSFVSELYEATACRVPIVSLFEDETSVATVVDMLFLQLQDALPTSKPNL